MPACARQADGGRAAGAAESGSRAAALRTGCSQPNDADDLSAISSRRSIPPRTGDGDGPSAPISLPCATMLAVPGQAGGRRKRCCAGRAAWMRHDCAKRYSGATVSLVLDGARCRHRWSRIPALHPRHGRRLRADERRRLWPRGEGHAGRVRGRAALRRARQTLALDALAVPIATRHAAPTARSWSQRDLRGNPSDPDAIQTEMDRIAAAREASQPLRT